MFWYGVKKDCKTGGVMDAGGVREQGGRKFRVVLANFNQMQASFMRNFSTIKVRNERLTSRDLRK